MIALDAGLTDLLLTAVAAAGAIALFRTAHREAAIGLVLIGVASTFGTVRFLAIPELAQLHDAATRLAALLGIPLVGLGWLVAMFPAVRERRGLAFRVLGVVAIAANAAPDAGLALGAAGMAAAIVAAARAPDRVATVLGAVGAAGVLAAGLLVAGEGSWLGLARLAWFHLALAASLALLAVGLARIRPPAPPA